jgi:hypothetical protein
MLRCGLVVCAVAVAIGLMPVVASADSCENESQRIGQGSTFLPDCRAYEMVTPAIKDSGEPKAVEVGLFEPSLEGVEGARASVSGERLAWVSEYSLPGSQSPGLGYLSTRSENEWKSEDVIPPQTVANGALCSDLVTMAAYSSDLSQGVLTDGYGQDGGFKGEALHCGHDQPLLVTGEPEGFQNLFLRDNNLDSFQLVNVTPNGAPAPKLGPGNGPQYFPAAFLAGSTDLSHVVFEEELPLTPDAPAGDDLYEWAAGVVHLVTVLPDGDPVVGSLASATRNTAFEEGDSKYVPFNIANFRHVVSGNGSRVFFEADGNLYIRLNADHEQSPLDGKGNCIEPEDACTVQVDAPQGSGGGGGGKFMVASEDGSRVFFTDASSAGLTSDTVAGSGQNLYEYDLDDGRLTDLTPTGEANVDGVSGASEDGSYVYFVAEGVLAAGATAGQPNLYLIHTGVISFIASLDPTNDSCDWLSPECVRYPGLGGLTARVSANGAFIGFESDERLTGYDNIGPSCVPLHEGTQIDGFEAGACQEIYLYEAAANKLNCASCDPDGATPMGPAFIRYPAKAGTDEEMRNAFPQRNVSNDGQVFFETPDSLVSRDTNGTRDVYEYENGVPYLISSGTSAANSYFLDASVDGSNVFFVTAEKLVPRDTDDAYDIYDARIGGGFTEPVAPSEECGNEGCRSPVSINPPAFSTPSSMTFNGAGNVVHATEGDTGKVSATAPGKVRGTVFTLSVMVPSRGRIIAFGSLVKTVSRSVKKAATYRLAIKVTSRARHALKKRRSFKVKIQIFFEPTNGARSVTSISVIVKA